MLTTRGRIPSTLSLILIALAGLIWYAAAITQNPVGGSPLSLVGLAIVVRLSDPKHLTWPSSPISYGLLLLIFGLTALVGANGAYDPAQGWAKFWVLVGGICLFGAIVSQGKEQGGVLLGLLSGAAALVALNFLLTHDWQQHPADIGLLNRVGLAWMGLRPQLSLPAIHPNFAGGILMMLLPFQVVGVRRNSGELGGTQGNSRFGRQFIFFVVILGLSVGALLLTSSRGAWLSLAAATGVWVLWLMCGWLATRVQRPRASLFWMGLGLSGAAAILLVLLFPGGLIGLVNRLPGLASGESRWEIYQNTIRLVADYPFTGGGLHSFPGLYSRYILNIPYFLFDYSHNMYLDILLEHGVLGFLAFMGLILGSLWLVLRSALTQYSVLSTHHSAIRWAAIVSLVAVLLHGLMDNALHGGPGSPLLFVPVALALWATPIQSAKPHPESTRRGWKTALVWLILLLLPTLWLMRPRQGHWSANQAAVLLAQAELAGWPELEREIDQQAVQTAAAAFQAVHNAYPNNLTANYRLGLLAAAEGDAAAALPHLEAAYQADPGHRGVIKTLGYSYVWLGQLDKAAPLLAQIPEAATEMGTYSWWWGTQDRPDLAESAAAMLTILLQP